MAVLSRIRLILIAIGISILLSTIIIVLPVHFTRVSDCKRLNETIENISKYDVISYEIRDVDLFPPSYDIDFELCDENDIVKHVSLHVTSVSEKINNSNLIIEVHGKKKGLWPYMYCTATIPYDKKIEPEKVIVNYSS